MKCRFCCSLIQPVVIQYGKERSPHSTWKDCPPRTVCFWGTIPEDFRSDKIWCMSNDEDGLHIPDNRSITTSLNELACR